MVAAQALCSAPTLALLLSPAQTNHTPGKGSFRRAISRAAPAFRLRRGGKPVFRSLLMVAVSAVATCSWIAEQGYVAPRQAGRGVCENRSSPGTLRHTFWQFRRENPQTNVGEPPPDGLPGFNSGVMLLNLEAMRQSQLYNQLLEPDMVRQLTEKYHFKGHLGDQDFFTMIGMEHPELFHVLDCTWNRQLCTWWRDHGYSDVFDQYFRCDGQVRIYHGNCNTPIPED